MPPVVTITDNLASWDITLAGGATRTVLASSAQAAIGNAPNIVSVTKGAGFTGEPVPPVASTLVPATAAIGAANFTLHVNGTGFRTGMQILWNGSPEPTTFVSDTELTTLVDMTTAVVPLLIPVKVRTLAGQESNELTFTITAAELQESDEGGRGVDVDETVPLRGGASSPAA